MMSSNRREVTLSNKLEEEEEEEDGILLSSLTADRIWPITKELIIVLHFCHIWETNTTHLGRLESKHKRWLRGNGMCVFISC